MRFSIALVVLAVGCGGKSKTEAPEAPDESGDRTSESLLSADFNPSDRTRESVAPELEQGGDDLQVEGAKGHLSNYEVRKVVKRHWKGMKRCFLNESRNARYIGGAVELQYYVSPKGSVKEVYMTSTDLGSWGVERCIVEEAKQMKFRAPGGTGTDFTLPMEFPAYEGSVPWSASESATVLKKKVRDLRKCRKGPKRANVTFYVVDGGLINQAGFSASQPIPEAWASCMQEKMKEWTLDDPNGQTLKSSFLFKR